MTEKWHIKKDGSGWMVTAPDGVEWFFVKFDMAREFVKGKLYEQSQMALAIALSLMLPGLRGGEMSIDQVRAVLGLPAS